MPNRWNASSAFARRFASVCTSPMVTCRAASYMSSQKAFGTPLRIELRRAIEHAALAVTPIMSSLYRRPRLSVILRLTS